MSLTPRLDRLEKNYIINGAFDYFQRATAAVNLSGTLAYVTADRFLFAYTGTMTGTPTSGRSTDVPSNGLSLYSNQFISRRNASASSLQTQHRIESANARELSGKVASLSVWVKPATATTLRLRVATPTVIDTFGTLNSDAVNTTQTILANNTWQQVKFENFSVPANATNGLMIQIDMESASGTDGANTNHYIAQICLNKGSTAVDDFCRSGRDISDELRMCQRYYQKSYLLEEAVPTVSAYGIYLATIVDSAAELKCQVLLPQHMRATPTLTSYKVDGTSGQIEYQRNGGANVAFAPLIQGLGTNKFSWRATGFTAGDRIVLIGHYSLSAEL